MKENLSLDFLWAGLCLHGTAFFTFRPEMLKWLACPAQAPLSAKTVPCALP